MLISFYCPLQHQLEHHFYIASIYSSLDPCLSDTSNLCLPLNIQSYKFPQSAFISPASLIMIPERPLVFIVPDERSSPPAVYVKQINPEGSPLTRHCAYAGFVGILNCHCLPATRCPSFILCSFASHCRCSHPDIPPIYLPKKRHFTSPPRSDWNI